MKLNLGNGHTWKRRLDDLRYAPADAVRRVRSARERGLAAWAGYGAGQRLSSLGLASAVVIAVVVIFTGGGEGGLDLVVTNDTVSRADGASTSARPRRDVEPGTSASVDETTPATAGAVLAPTLIDDSAVVTEPARRSDTKVLGATTVPGKNAKGKKVAANGSALTALFEAALTGASTSTPPPTSPPASGAPAPTSPPGTSPAPPTTRPASAPPTTRPPATTPPTTRPPATAPPTTRPPTTVPPTTRPPTTVPPTTDPPTTVPPTTDPPVTVPPTTDPPSPPTTDPPRPTPPED